MVESAPTAKSLDREETSSLDSQLFDDFAKALYHALLDEPEGARANGAVILGKLRDFGDIQTALQDVLREIGERAYGAVLLYGLKEKSSLRGHAESALHHLALSRLGVTMRDLQWPEEDLEWPWKDAALLHDNGRILSPPVDFIAAERKARELGYREPFQRALLEYYLVAHRWHGAPIARVRAINGGIKDEDWDQILAAFTAVDSGDKP